MVCSILRAALMLTGSMNYSLSLGFMLTFLLAALGVNSILYTFRNLARLNSHRAAFSRCSRATKLTSRWLSPTLERSRVIASGSRTIASRTIYTDVAAGAAVTVSVAVPALRRGIL